MPETTRVELSRHSFAAIAVVPFRTLGEAPEYLAFGLCEDLIHRLSQSLFPVIAPSSSTSCRAGQALADDHGILRVDYLVCGSVQLDRSELRVTARLVRVSDRQVLCAHRYACSYGGVFASQDELTGRIVEQVTSALLRAESARVLRLDPSDASAWELALRGTWHSHARTRQGNLDARFYFERALDKGRDLPLAWYGLAMTYQREIVNQWAPDPAEALARMRRVGAGFAQFFSSDPRALLVGAYLSVYSGDRDAARSRLVEAIELDPNLPAAHSLYGQALAMANEPDLAIEQLDIAERLSPIDPEIWSVYTAKALAHFVAERYVDAVRWASQATSIRPELPFPYGTLASALGHLGCISEARAALSRMLELAPNSTVAGMATLVASTNRDIALRYQAGLQLAGLPPA